MIALLQKKKKNFAANHHQFLTIDTTTGRTTTVTKNQKCSSLSLNLALMHEIKFLNGQSKKNYSFKPKNN
jgi:hypothetical protein